jgi:glutamate-1-semialdehyde 2,1-aminomutase
MLKNGVYLAPSPFEAMFICDALTKKDVEKTIAAVHNSLKAVSADKK